MKLSTTSEVVEALWEALRVPTRIPNARRAAAYFVETILQDQEGWAETGQVDDILHDLGFGRLVRFDLLQLFRVPTTMRVLRPRRREPVLLVEQVAAADIAQMLINLERLGFRVDPRPFVAPLRSAIRRKHMLTTAELALLWYHRERRRCGPIFVEAPGNMTCNRWIDLPTGYSATLDDATPDGFCRLIVAAPRTSRRQARAA